MIDSSPVLVQPMTERLSPGVARRLLQDWDATHLRQDRDRFSRIDLMIDILDAQMPSRFTVLDLGAGPGSVSRRILDRIPRASVIALEVRPFFVRMGARALDGYDGRCRWVTADFCGKDWDTSLPEESIDAVFSHAALHRLRPARIQGLYRSLARHLHPGGILLNGDRIPWSTRQKPLNDLANRIRKIRTRRGVRSSQRETSEGWAKWWAHVRTVTELRKSINQWNAHATKERPPKREVDLETHVRFLREAGFRSVATVWQNLDARVILATK